LVVRSDLSRPQIARENRKKKAISDAMQPKQIQDCSQEIRLQVGRISLSFQFDNALLSSSTQGIKARTIRDGAVYRAINSDSNLVPCPAEPTTLIDR
jgi:hypothetical protein